MLQTICGWRLPCDPSDYHVSEERGFLLATDPTASLQSIAAATNSETTALFTAWEDCARALPSMLCAGSVREQLRGLPLLSSCPSETSAASQEDIAPWLDMDPFRRMNLDSLKFDAPEQARPANWLAVPQDEAAAECAMLILSFIAHAWVWGEHPVAQSIPENISRPWVAVARVVQRPPILTYYSFNACNWRRLDPGRPIELGNTCRLVNFLGGQDEEWFSAVHVAIEAQAGSGIIAAVRAKRQLTAHADGSLPAALVSELTTQLQAIATAVQRMHSILQRMK
eukprot:scaffold25191_cov53-Prasinocladus_malaysianus.AAC.1